jgi:hypothetical protein
MPALAFIVSKNLARRHLLKAERALVADRLATLKRGGKRKSEQAKNQTVKRQFDLTVKDAAAMMGVGRTNVVAA